MQNITESARPPTENPSITSLLFMLSLKTDSGCLAEVDGVKRPTPLMQYIPEPDYRVKLHITSFICPAAIVSADQFHQEVIRKM